MKFNDLVEEGKKKFQRELESLMPDVKPGKGQRVCVCLLCYTPLLKIFHSHGEITFAIERLQNVDLYDWHLRLFLSGRDIYHTIML